MSLPPLVCNTPPPPDQCDDDHDPEDYDINYNLSQDEEDSNGYDYQTYTNYSMYETSKSEDMEKNWILTVNNALENVEIENGGKEKVTDSMTPIIDSLSQKLMLDDVAVEDLNLEISHEQLNSQLINSGKIDTDSSDNDYSLKEITVPIDNKMPEAESHILETDTVISSNSETVLEISSKISEITKSTSIVDNYESTSKTYELSDEFDDFHSNVNSKNNETDNQEQSLVEQTCETELKVFHSKIQNQNDFVDFHFVRNNSDVTTIIENFENPWINEIPHEDIAGFEANFDESNINSNSNNDHFKIENKDMDIRLENQISKDFEDDFEDFDDFKSCTKQHYVNIDQSEELKSNNEIPVMDFYTPDNENQILETINSVFTSIFEEEISQSDSEYTGRLESVLNDTWGHLVDTDIRQPYMLNWNNSLGQKSLLKALCIDSRNILFGPKWNYNMPKYAVNLCAAPLQPQKQLTSQLPQTDLGNINKTTTNETEAWIDPFSSNGQEFTYAEALLLDLEHLMATLDQMAHKHTSFKISELLSHACNNGHDTASLKRASSDVAALEKVISPKTDNIYATSLNVQTLRQINLPDTHIFTPSDSETPRSNTIHYDSISKVVIAQPITNDKSTSPQFPVDKIVDTVENDNTYWEFQDFKSTSEIVHSTENKVEDKLDKKSEESEGTNGILPNICAPYQTQLLQPIKVEPLTPTLNWPNPGEVKETFGDFSDFISSTSWENNKHNIPNTDTYNLNLQVKTLVLDKNNDTPYNDTSSNSEKNDDDFEKFQSGPSLSQTNNVKTVEISKNELTCQPSYSKIKTFGTFSEFDQLNSNELNASDNINARVTEFMPDDHNHGTSGVGDDFGVNSPIHSSAIVSVLKPTVLSVSSNNTTCKQKKSGQILQPLSLEGYSQINWPNPGINLQDLSRFNPVETLPSLKGDSSTSNQSKVNSPAHYERTSARKEVLEDDIWGDFVSSKPKQQVSATKKLQIFGDEEEWTEFVSSPTVKPQNGLNTISLNVHTNLSMKKSSHLNKLNTKTNHISLDIPTLNYITPKSINKTYDDKHYQNL